MWPLPPCGLPSASCVLPELTPSRISFFSGPPNPKAQLATLLRPLRVEHLSLRVLRCDTVGPYRLPRDRVCAIDEALDHIAAAIGEDGDERGPGGRLLGEVPSLHEVVVEVCQRELRWTRGLGHARAS